MMSGKDIVWEIKVEDVTANLEENNEASIKFYPIPVSETLKIESNHSNSTHVELVNVFGAIVKRTDIQKDSSTQIDIKMLNLVGCL